MNLCLTCLPQGFCRKRRTHLVTDVELASGRFRWDVRKKAYGLGLTPVEWVDAIHDLYSQCPGWIMHADGNEVFLDMNEFERPHIREWFRDWVCDLPARPETQRLHPASKERIRILATIMRAHFPAEAMLWGKEIANDN